MNKYILLLFLCHQCCVANDRITMGAILFPPYAMLDEETGQCTGKVLTITDKVLSEYGLDLIALCATPSRIYQLMANGEVDFTVNIQQTSSLDDSTIFVDPPFRQLQLNIYSHKELTDKKDIAGIRGFNYQGQRDKLVDKGYTFYNMPTSISAIQLFVKKQSTHLLSYESSVDFLVAEKKLNFANSVDVTHILNVTTHYAISGKSKHKATLQNAFTSYAKNHNVTYFKLIETDTIASN